VALGNAEGRGSITATAGEVTGLNQTITASEEEGSTVSGTLSGMIQTDANIVPGDSGGPLAGSIGVIGMTPRATTSVTSSRRQPDSRIRSTRRCQ